MLKLASKYPFDAPPLAAPSEILAEHPMVYQKWQKDTVLKRNKQKQTVALVNRKKRSQFGKTEG